MTWSNVNYDLTELGGPEKWDEIREEYGDKVEDLLSEYGTNIREAKINRYCASPLDYYRRNPSAIKTSAYLVILKAMIWAVTVVPTFAPMITPTD